MIILFDSVRDAFECRGRMIKLTGNFNSKFGMSRDRVIINRDPAIGYDKLAVDIDLLFDQYRFDWKVSHFHRQHPLSMRTHVIWVFGESNSANASTPGDPGLNFDNHVVA